MLTNANIPEVAQLIKDARTSANFTSLIIRRKGVRRGGKVYGDDKVHSVFITGFSYKRLCKRSLDSLTRIKSSDVLSDLQHLYTNMTLAHIVAARHDLREGLKRSTAGTNPISDVFDPLRVNGEIVRGAKVYSGPGNSSDPRAPVPGTIYIQGLGVGHKILEKAANGPPPRPNYSMHTAIKNHIRWRLPVGRYVSYALTPGQDFELKIGGQAKIAVEQNNVKLSP